MFKRMVVSFLLGMVIAYVLSCAGTEKLRKKFTDRYVLVASYHIYLEEKRPKFFMAIYDDLETFWPMDYACTWSLASNQKVIEYYKDKKGILWQEYVNDNGVRVKERIRNVVIGGEQVMR